VSLRSKVKEYGEARRTRVRVGIEMARERSALGAGTRERLFHVARELFAERGYHHVTVRDISRLAGANLAAVGYHFGDKLGLYRMVVEGEIASVRKLNQQLAMDAELAPEDAIRQYVRHYLPRMIHPEAQVEWFQRLIRHEMTQPTPIAQELALKMFRPRMQYLAGAVAKLMDCDEDDRRVQHSVFSIQAQCMFYVRDSFRSMVFVNWFPQTPEDIRAAADHITDFSLAGIRALARKPGGSARGPGGRPRRRVED
jgi:AcrR family transcriptional regulator